MAITTIKLSQLPFAGNTKQGDTVTGLRDALNTNFNGQSTQYVTIPAVMVNGLTQQMNPNTCYVANNAGVVTLTLPEIFGFGDIFEIIGYGGGGWQIAQNALQQIFLGPIGTTQGIGGFIASSSGMDSIILKGIVPNQTLITLSGPQGNINWN